VAAHRLRMRPTGVCSKPKGLCATSGRKCCCSAETRWKPHSKLHSCAVTRPISTWPRRSAPVIRKPLPVPTAPWRDRWNSPARARSPATGCGRQASGSCVGFAGKSTNAQRQPAQHSRIRTLWQPAAPNRCARLPNRKRSCQSNNLYGVRADGLQAPSCAVNPSCRSHRRLAASTSDGVDALAARASASV